MAASSSYARRSVKSYGVGRKPRSSRYTPKTYTRSKPISRVVVYRSSGETKGMDTILTQPSGIISTTNTNANAIVVNLVQQGAGSWNRVGRKIHSSSLRISGIANYLYGATATTDAYYGGVLRMVVVWDKQPSGNAIPTFDTIFGKTTQSGTESTTFLDPIRYDNMDRFSVLRDIRLQSDPDLYNDGAGTNPIVSNAVPFDEYINLNNRETVFGGQSDPMTIADISTGALYIYFRAQSPSTDPTSTWLVSSDSYARLRYVD